MTGCCSRLAARAASSGCEAGSGRADQRLPFRKVVHAGKSFEVHILRPQLCVRTPCSYEDDAVCERKAMPRAGHSRLQRERGIEVDHPALLHQPDAAQRCAFVTLLQHAIEPAYNEKLSKRVVPSSYEGRRSHVRTPPATSETAGSRPKLAWNASGPRFPWITRPRIRGSPAPGGRR